MPSPHTRRDLLRSLGAGGSMLAGVGLTGTPVLADQSTEHLSPRQLEETVKSAVETPDVRPLLTEDQYVTLSRGTIHQLSDHGSTIWLATQRDVSTPTVASAASTDVVMAGTIPTDSPDTDVTVLSFVSPTADTAILYEHHGEPRNGIRTQARLFEIKGTDVGSASLHLHKRRVNGEPTISAKELNKIPETVTPSDYVPPPGGGDPCGGCQPGPGGTGYRQEDGSGSCVEFDISCGLRICSRCIGACGNKVTCVACVLGICGWTAMAECCDEWENPECVSCPSTL